MCIYFLVRMEILNQLYLKICTWIQVPEKVLRLYKPLIKLKQTIGEVWVKVFSFKPTYNSDCIQERGP